MNFSQVRAFHAVAETGSITGAAEKLHVTQPAITLQLKALHEHYGIGLTFEKGRKIELTAEGKALFLITQRLFGVIREAGEYLDAYSGEREHRFIVNT